MVSGFLSEASEGYGYTLNRWRQPGMTSSGLFHHPVAERSGGSATTLTGQFWPRYWISLGLKGLIWKVGALNWMSSNVL